MPTQRDMQISLDDAGFFCEKIDEIVRGQPEQQQNLELVRRYFRAYLHCWKCIIYYICEEKGMNGKEFGKWVRRKWLKRRSSPHANEDIGSLDALRKTRDEDTQETG